LEGGKGTRRVRKWETGAKIRVCVALQQEWQMWAATDWHTDHGKNGNWNQYIGKGAKGYWGGGVVAISRVGEKK